jgi:hypothetical protein
MNTVNALLLAAACLFVLFVLSQAVLPAVMRRGPRREVQARLTSAVTSGTNASRSASDRAASFREAADIALRDLKKPRLALRYARWAHDADPSDAANIELLAKAMMRAGRHRALERHLWRSLDAHADEASFNAAFTALLALYNGPMKAPERARVLRAIRRNTNSTEITG